MNEVIISFPGLGIGEFTINKVAFSIGPLEVRWYGIIITLGIVAGVLYAMYRARYEGISTDDVLDYAIWTVLLAVIGARAYFVLTTLKDDAGRWNYHSFRDVIAIWEGGIAIYGAIIGGALALALVTYLKKYKKDRLFKVFDMVAPGVMLGQIIGRWGNFVNGEAHGIKTSDTFFLRMGLGGAADTEYVNRITYYHPTFLYESLWNLLGFVLINLLYKKKKFDGQVILMYLTWYGLGRMFIEGIRTDSLYVGVFRISQVVGFLCFAICGTLLTVLLIRQSRKKKDGEAYEPLYAGVRGVTPRVAPRAERTKEEVTEESPANTDTRQEQTQEEKEKEG